MRRDSGLDWRSRRQYERDGNRGHFLNGGGRMKPLPFALAQFVLPAACRGVRHRRLCGLLCRHSRACPPRPTEPNSRGAEGFAANGKKPQAQSRR
jgi:hypothetical protein